MISITKDVRKNRGIENILKLPKMYLNFTGCWTYENPTYFILVCRYTAFAMPFFMTLFGIIDTLNYIDDFVEISGRMTMTSSMIAFIIKLYIFLYNQNKFMALLKHLQIFDLDLYHCEFDHHLQHAAKICTRLGNLYQFLCGSVVIVFPLVPLFSGADLPYYFPWKVYGLTKIAIYVYYAVTLGLSASLNGSMDILVSSLMCIASALIKICNDRIRNCYNNDDNEENTIQSLKLCVQYHIKIIE